MSNERINDMRAIVLGAGGALVAYYGYAAHLVMGGNAVLDCSTTWMGLAGGIAAIGWVLSTVGRRGNPIAQ
ncbi:TPA: hypothetical protein QDB04_006668 [Burkholderia vietnamiensis]|nr:hypothetical protein [Burkholderia vietnamiensis]